MIKTEKTETTLWRYYRSVDERKVYYRTTLVENHDKPERSYILITEFGDVKGCYVSLTIVDQATPEQTIHKLLCDCDHAYNSLEPIILAGKSKTRQTYIIPLKHLATCHCHFEPYEL